MEKTKEELIAELNELQKKYSALEEKYNEEISVLKKNKEDTDLKLMFLEGVANSTIEGFLVVNPYGQKILQNKRTIELWKIPLEIANHPDGMKQATHVMNMTVNPQQFMDEIEYQKIHPDSENHDELELKDGTILERYSSPVIDADGKNHGRIYTFHDITERKKLEEQLIQLNSDKDRFISILAHDLRSPFNSLLGFSELLKKKIRTYPIEKTEKMVDMINITARKTHELLEDTLIWASIQTKKITFNPSETNITETISEVLEILNPIAKAKNINIVNNVLSEMCLISDVYMLKAIIRNLVSNAIKFTIEGGSIELFAEHNGTETIIRVKDSGIGIEPEILESLFSFGSKHSTIGTANEMGTGLGLMLCKEFIDKHGGKIWIDSKVNIGTTVSFSIPDQKID